MPLVLAATPIGNLGDASARLRDALATADVVAAEDTRRLRRLLSGLGVESAARVVSYYDGVEQSRTPGLLEDLRAGRTVVLVTDAGTPLVSDPGYRLLTAAADEGIEITVVPGPSAVLAALAVAGIPADRWCFEGFLPRRAGERRTRLGQLAGDGRTLVLFEAPHRLQATLHDMVDAFGGKRRAAVCRELTKTHEEVRRGTLADLAAQATDDPPRGEITIVVGGADAITEPAAPAELAAAVELLVAEGRSTRDAVDAVAASYGLARRIVYDAAKRGGRKSSGDASIG